MQYLKLYYFTLFYDPFLFFHFQVHLVIDRILRQTHLSALGQALAFRQSSAGIIVGHLLEINSIIYTSALRL